MRRTRSFLHARLLRRRAKDDLADTPEAAERRTRAHDQWRSRNAWNYGDLPGVGGLH